MAPSIRRVVRVSLMVLTAAFLLGHICELPLGELVLGHAEGGEAHDHGDSLHVASCEATTSAPMGSSVVPYSEIHAGAVAEISPIRRVAVLPPPPAPPPPVELFVLYLALLI